MKNPAVGYAVNLQAREQAEADKPGESLAEVFTLPVNCVYCTGSFLQKDLLQFISRLIAEISFTKKEIDLSIWYNLFLFQEILQFFTFNQCHIDMCLYTSFYAE